MDDSSFRVAVNAAGASFGGLLGGFIKQKLREARDKHGAGFRSALAAGWAAAGREPPLLPARAESAGRYRPAPPRAVSGIAGLTK
jgi:hypothetical protein